MLKNMAYVQDTTTEGQQFTPGNWPKLGHACKGRHMGNLKLFILPPSSGWLKNIHNSLIRRKHLLFNYALI